MNRTKNYPIITSFDEIMFLFCFFTISCEPNHVLIYFFIISCKPNHLFIYLKITITLTKIKLRNAILRCEPNHAPILFLYYLMQTERLH